ncbi:hypothetical protein KAI78_01730 [bacterium]|nr:hypothetical protein [bacterium]
MEDNQRWAISDEDLVDLNPAKVVELMIQCFFAAQKETFRQAKDRLGFDTSDDKIMNSVRTIVKKNFKSIDVVPEEANLDDIIKVMENLAYEAKCFGTSDEIIHHHQQEMMKVIVECKKKCGGS